MGRGKAPTYDKITIYDDASIRIDSYNLTKDEAPALIHFGSDRTEQWLLVRLKNPDASPAQSN